MTSFKFLGLVLCPFVLGCAAVESRPDLRNPSSASLSASQKCRVLHDLEIHAHRGSNERPENMISAFERGVEMGGDMIELDLQVSKDDQVIVAHDAFLRSDCLDSQGKELTKQVFFRDLTLRQIKTFDCGSKPKIGRPVPGEKVPTLAEVFKSLKNRVTRRGRPIGLNIEIKYNPTQPQFYPNREIYAGLVLKAVRESGWDSSRLMLQSFDVGLLEVLRSQGATYRMSPLLSDAKEGIAIAGRLRADTITPHYGQVNSEMIRKFHAAGIRIIPWTVNDIEEAIRLVDLGVDGIATDRLDLFLFAKNFCSQN